MRSPAEGTLNMPLSDTCRIAHPEGRRVLEIVFRARAIPGSRG